MSDGEEEEGDGHVNGVMITSRKMNKKQKKPLLSCTTGTIIDNTTTTTTCNGNRT